jgi:hypothetical protein
MVWKKAGDYGEKKYAREKNCPFSRRTREGKAFQISWWVMGFFSNFRHIEAYKEGVCGKVQG